MLKSLKEILLFKIKNIYQFACWFVKFSQYHFLVNSSQFKIWNENELILTSFPTKRSAGVKYSLFLAGFLYLFFSKNFPSLIPKKKNEIKNSL